MVGLIETQEKNFGSVVEARDYLASRKIQSFHCHGNRMSFGVDGGIGHFYIKGNSETRAFPVRETGIEGLLGRTEMGQGSFPWKVCDDHLLTYNINYLLQNHVAEKKFTVIIENGELKALMSDGYSPVNHSRVLDIIDGLDIDYKVHHLNLTKDHFRACITNPANKVAFKIDDISSIGVDLINSENGHAALALGQYVYRYWCLNGCSRVDQSQSVKSRAIHRGAGIYKSIGEFQEAARYYLQFGAEELEKNFRILAEKPVTENFLRRVTDKVQIAVGKKNTEKLVDEWEKSTGAKPCESEEWSNGDYTKYQDNRYDFAQLVTKSAHRDYSGLQRLQMEKVGGYIYGSGANMN